MRDTQTAAMTGSTRKTQVTEGRRDAMAPFGRASGADSAERDFVLARFQEMVDSGLANWWLNEDGGTELHLSTGEAFLLQDQGVLCLR